MKYLSLSLLVLVAAAMMQGCPAAKQPSPAPQAAPPTASLSSPSASAAITGGALSPPEGALLQAKHVLFTFDTVPEARAYQLQVYLPGGTSPVVNKVVAWPRFIAKSGIEFGKIYAWRTRPLDADLAPGPWSEFHSFKTAPLPPAVQNILTVVNHAPDKVEPGLVLFNEDDTKSNLGGPYALAVDENGEVVWFLRRAVLDLRMLRNGNLLYRYAGEAVESTLDGTIVWTTAPFGMDIDGHEIFDMPNGNVMLNTFEFREVERDGVPQTWMGHVLTEIQRDGTVVWSWNTLDHINVMDFDACIMDHPPFNGIYDWLHGNGLVYDARDRSVYYSIRHLSRIVKIDYDTGGIIWNLGANAASGEVPFGDNLFSFQHAPEPLANGNLLLYNNGNRRDGHYCGPPNPFSTAIEMKIDPLAEPPVTVVWEYAQDFFTNSRGDADRMPNGNTLVCAGSSGRIFEVTQANEVVWELQAPVVMYRAEKIPSLYPLRGDFDGDDDIDLDDLNDFLKCYSGADVFSIHRDCLVHDYDEDGDVDEDDYNQLLANFTGPGI